MTKRAAWQALSVGAVLALLGSACGTAAPSAQPPGTSAKVAAAQSVSCPNGGTVRMGVEPYEDQAALAPLYNPIAKYIGQQLGCTVQLIITSNYTAEIEAMQNRKLEFGEFGPLGYFFAHQVAHAVAVATFGTNNVPATYTASVVTWPGSGITTLKQCAGKTFGYSDPASTSGHLFPAYALKQAGIDPNTGVSAQYAGSHTASYEALINHKVICGELNSETIATSTAAGQYKASNFVTLWKSAPIPDDPIALSPSLSPAFSARLTSVLTGIKFSDFGATVAKGLNSAIGGTGFVSAANQLYAPVFSLVPALGISISSLNT